MCGDLKTLATLDDERFVARCNCGCVHLVWRHLTLRMHASDLARVIAQLTPALQQQAHSSVHVWLGMVGLHLYAAEFKALMALLQQAHTALAQWPSGVVALPQQHGIGLPN
jgi:hypothetical protein